MKAIRLTDEARAVLNAAIDAVEKPAPMTRAEEVRALMEKGMKIVFARGYYVWAFVPRVIALSFGAPYSATFPAHEDLADYLAHGGELVQVL